MISGNAGRARGGRQGGGQDRNRRGFTGAVETEESKKLTRYDSERDAVNRMGGGVFVAFGQVLYLDNWLHQGNILVTGLKRIHWPEENAAHLIVAPQQPV